MVYLMESVGKDLMFGTWGIDKTFVGHLGMLDLERGNHHEIFWGEKRDGGLGSRYTRL